MAEFCDEQAAEHSELEGKAPASRALFGIVEAEI